MNPLTVTSFPDKTGRPFLDDLARLRIAVFAEWPYLYEGTLEYEQHYLRKFFKTKGSILVLARDGQRVVGASTGLPLLRESAALKRPFVQAGYDLRRIFYFSESILLPEYRGRGIGVRFFEHREAWARAQGYQTAVFCGVVRPPDHPRRPSGYVPLDDFWNRRGFQQMGPDMVGHIAWKDHDEPEESEKPLQFWVKTL